MRRKRGQSLTEYAALIAFIGTLVALVFAIGRGALFATTSASYSSNVNSLQQLNAAVLAVH